MPLLKDIPASDPPIEENPSDELLTGEAAGRFDEVWESAEGGGDAARGGRGRGGSPRRPRPEVSPRRSPGWRRSPRRGPRGPRPEDGLPGSAPAPALALAAEEEQEEEEEEEEEQEEQEQEQEEGPQGNGAAQTAARRRGPTPEDRDRPWQQDPGGIGDVGDASVAYDAEADLTDPGDAEEMEEEVADNLEGREGGETSVEYSRAELGMLAEGVPGSPPRTPGRDDGAAVWGGIGIGASFSPGRRPWARDLVDGFSRRTAALFAPPCAGGAGEEGEEDPWAKDVGELNISRRTAALAVCLAVLVCSSVAVGALIGAGAINLGPQQTSVPTQVPTPALTGAPTFSPTVSARPTSVPTSHPTSVPTSVPTGLPTPMPVIDPSRMGPDFELAYSISGGAALRPGTPQSEALEWLVHRDPMATTTDPKRRREGAVLFGAERYAQRYAYVAAVFGLVRGVDLEELQELQEELAGAAAAGAEADLPPAGEDPASLAGGDADPAKACPWCGIESVPQTAPPQPTAEPAAPPTALPTAPPTSPPTARPAQRPEDQPEAISDPPSCVDGESDCEQWAFNGECGKNPGYMHSVCSKSCNRCSPPSPAASGTPAGTGGRRRSLELEEALLSTLLPAGKDVCGFNRAYVRCNQDKKVTRIILREMGLTGTILPEIGILNRTLTVLDLADNNLAGTIPKSLYSCTQMTGLYLKSNRLSGTIASKISDLRSLTQLYLGQNRLTGKIPTGIQKLKWIRE